MSFKERVSMPQSQIFEEEVEVPTDLWEFQSPIHFHWLQLTLLKPHDSLQVK